MKYCFIINPKAGSGNFSDSLQKNISSVCEKMGASYDVFISKTVGDTKQYIKDTVGSSEEKVEFIACGGDGTLCETILAVMGLDSETRGRVCVGVIPKGTGNDFVSNFDSSEIFNDIAAQLEATDYDIDLLLCNDMYSVNMINIGFDCHVVCKKEEIGKKKFVPRKLAYIISLLITLIKKPGVKYELEKDSKKRSPKDLLLTTFANGGFCGGGFNSNPVASLTDGNIDCIEVNNIGRGKFLRLVGDYKKGKHLGGKFKDIISHFKCKCAHLYFEKETPVSIDGEIIRTKELHISVVARALKIMLPKGVKPLVAAEGAK